MLRRRRADWGGEPRPETLSAATATLEADYALTAAHSDDVVSLSEAIADELGVTGRERAAVLAAAALHDIGKVAVPQEIVDKPGPLASHEWEVVRRHTLAGERIVRSVPELDEVAQLVRWSHERWDGLGYPDGLAGNQIPLASRIVFCADAYHAIRCDRPYRAGRSAERALAEVRENAGTQFDPQVVEALDAAAGRLRASRRVRVRALAGGFRTRRAAVLLLALAISGSALAATGGGPFKHLLGADTATEAVGCGAATCEPADLGPLGQPFPTATANAAAAQRATRARAAAAAKRAARRRAAADESASGAGTAGGPVTTGGTNGGGRSGFGRAGGRSQAHHHSTPTRTGRPTSPGRSGEAPGRVKHHGKPPTTGAPGRSEEAPGRPDSPPGQFGKGQNGR